MNSNELLDALKKHADVPSDYALAKKILKVDVTAIRNMRERGLSEARAVQIASLLGIDPVAVLAAINAERAKDPAVKEVWETLVKTLASRAAAAIGAFGLSICLTVGVAQPVEAAQQFTRYTLCAVRRLRRVARLWLSILACFGLSTAPVLASDWTGADTARQAAYLALHAVDWNQTRWISKNSDQYVEINPFLGDEPSVARVDSYFAFSALAHTAISYALPPDWRKIWQTMTIFVEAGAVGYNYQVGVKIDF